jgi:threonine dehydrogenase-like Zn-dependent dehydrogenase
MGASSTVDPAPLAGAYTIARRLFCEHASPSPAEQDLLDAVKANQCEILFECSGHPRSMENSFLLAGSQITVFGYVPQPVEVVPAMWFAKELVIRNSKILSIDDLRAVTRLLEQGRIDTRPVVTHVMPFAEYDRALGLVSRREAIKVALVWE